MPEQSAVATKSSGSEGSSKLMQIAVVGAGLLCLWKMYQTCTVAVHPRCVTVVYDTRRKTILCTSVDQEMNKQHLPRVSHFSPVLYLGSRLVPRSNARLFVPPSSFFGVFTLPRTVLEEEGESVNCAVEDVDVCDGSINMSITVYYSIPFDQLERYLAAVGPVPPNEIIAIAAAQIARVRCAELSAGILLTKSRREGVFMGPYKDHLASKLMSEAAVEVQDVVVDTVHLIDS